MCVYPTELVMLPNRMPIMIWLYRLQQRLSITRHEGLAVVTLTLLFVTGLTVRHVQQQQVPPLSVDSLAVQPSASTAGAPAASTPSAPTPDRPLNVNGASASAMEDLPGIGPALAGRIVQYRSHQRPFQQIRELQRVRGIGPKTLADLRPLVTVAPPDTSAS